MAATQAKRTLTTLACALLLAAGISSCGRDDKPKTTQVAAKVNG
ncbi:MAG TPA: hypothetical protein PK129_18645 [Cellvibrionaceae bacterium]|nr:hypothetical protein [Cellvibrionaceae bacterium]